MEKEKQDVIRIEEQDEIIEIIDKINRTSEKTVTLLVPRDAAILQDITNLKILQKKAVEMGKEISISRAVAESNFDGMESHNPSAGSIVPQKDEKKIAGATFQTKKFSDMVSKGETVDLRKIDSVRQKTEAGALAATGRGESAASPVETRNATFLFEDNSQKENHSFVQEKEDSYRGSADDASVSGEEPEHKEARRIKREELFGDENRLDGTNGGNNRFDFSYGHNKKKRKRFILPAGSAKIFAAFITLCVITAAFSLFFVLPKANIAIALKQEETKGDFSFILDKSISEIDASAGKIPAKTAEISSQKTQTFSAAGKKHLTTKASGELTIYNECSTGDQVLVAGTRFLSKDGSKIFKIESSVTIPGFTKPEDSVVPGSKTVKVTAEETGEAYNIGATAFTIPKLQELVSWKYSCLYARSDKAMSGGSDKEVNYISQDDYDKAKETLVSAVKAENSSKASQQQDGDAVYIEEGTEGDPEVQASARVNDVIDQFEMTVLIKKPMLTVSKKDLEAALTQKIKEQANFQDAKPVEGGLAYELGDVVDKDKEISLNLSASQKFTFELNQDKINQIKREVMGKNKQELNDYFTAMNGIESVSVNLWPFWVSKVPGSVNKINISVTN